MQLQSTCQYINILIKLGLSGFQQDFKTDNWSHGSFLQITMEATGIPTYRLSAMGFSTYSADEILALSVKEAVNPQSFDNLLHPNIGGLYDPAYGPTERDDACVTCGQNYIYCPGHMGHIQLPLPVYNPVYFQMLLKILRGTCFHCHRLQAPTTQCILLTHQLRALEAGSLTAVSHLREQVGEILASQSQPSEESISERLEQYTSQLTVEQDDSDSVKNIVEEKKQLVKDFMKNFFSGTGKCPHCRMSARTLRAEHNSKICMFSRTKEQQQVAMADMMRKALERKRDHQMQQESEEGGMLGNTQIEDIQSNVQKSGGQTYLTAVEARNHLRDVWSKDSPILKSLFGALAKNKSKEPMDIFFVEVIPVTPSRFRPIVVMGDRRFENGQTSNLSRCIADTVVLKQILAEIKRQSVGQTETQNEPVRPSSLDDVPGDNLTEKLQSAWVRLQTHINCVVDSDLDKISPDKQLGIKQIIEKKDGLFRKHMMGKRVNFAARSVISPDPCINTNEIGIPIVFATRLTYPEPVNTWNVHELRQAVINGPNKHPGAVYVVNENGYKTLLSPTDANQRMAQAKQLLTSSSMPQRNGQISTGCKQVYRHVRNGDVLLLNRQPTLHRPSIQAHKAHVLPGERTLRMHYANCKAYNADFDGDEMNAHFPQNELCRSESYTLASTNHNYLQPRDGTPLAGLIQDHMVSGVSLTIRGRFFNRRDYQQLVYSALVDVPGRVKFQPPSILKPCRLWAGKQIISTILHNIIPEGRQPPNLTGKSKIPEKSWISAKFTGYSGRSLYPSGDEMGEGTVLIRDGDLLQGVLDKGHYGNTPYGMVHACYELYGGIVSGKLLTCLARLFMVFLQLRGFTLGVEDILVKPEANEERWKIMSKSRLCGSDVIREAYGLSEDVEGTALTDSYRAAHLCGIESKLAELDHAMKGKTDETQNTITKACMPYGLHKTFPANNLQLMVQSGAKGSTVNTMQISCLLGQIELEGRRPPIMVSGRSLPSFLPYDLSPRAGGFVDGRFLTGIRPQEYFFHCMAGREGLIDTAVKTSRSGYLQRCLIKHLEGLVMAYDMSVRDSDGSIVQFNYGEDGLDNLKIPYLQEKQFRFLIENRVSNHSRKKKKGAFDNFAVDVSMDDYEEVEECLRQKEVFQDKRKPSGFLTFCQKKAHKITDDESRLGLGKNGRSIAAEQMIGAWRNLSDKRRKKYSKGVKGCPDPLTTRLPSQCHLGVMSEQMVRTIRNYCQTDPHHQIQEEGEVFSKQHQRLSKHSGKLLESELWQLVSLKYQQCLIDPGEAVGLIAAQSIGEPSTQMTLNTFHFAGRGEMNVTLGIPRLREILMVASANIKTPAMEIPVRSVPNAKQKARHLQAKLNRVCLKEVLQDVSVCETLHAKSKGDCGRIYSVRFQFLRRDAYKERFSITPKMILHYMEFFYIKHLIDRAKKKMTELSKERLLSSGTIAQVQRNTSAAAPPVDEEENDSEIDAPEEDDAVARKTLERVDDSAEYRGEEEEQQEIGGDDDGSDEELATPQENPDEEDLEDDEGAPQSLTSTSLTEAKAKQKKKVEMSVHRINAVKSLSPNITAYEYDAGDELWCEVTMKFSLVDSKLDMTSLIEQEASRMVIHQVGGLSRCLLGDNKGQILFKTEGVNISAMYMYGDILDLNRLYSNDIHAIARVYGIEAASKVLIKEITGVFGAYGICVNYRHLSLVSDYMTFEGKYKPFNRLALESNASPLQKMSFENTMGFLRSSALHGMRDTLTSPSARLATGRVVKVGTGAFDVRHILF